MIMKKILALILSLFMILVAFSACNEGDGETDKGKNDGGKNEGKEIAFYVNYKSAKIELSADASAVLNSLGTPKSSEPQVDCSGKGSLTKYVYESVTVYVLDDGKTKTVDHITILDDSVKTPEGVTIGSERSAVNSAYGEKSGETSVTYSSGKKHLIIGFRDGSVSSIDYRVIG